MSKKKHIILVAVIAGLVSVSYAFFKTVIAGDFVVTDTMPAIGSE